MSSDEREAKRIFEDEIPRDTTFREFVLSVAYHDRTWLLVDADGNVLDEAVVDRGSVKFSSKGDTDDGD